MFSKAEIRRFLKANSRLSASWNTSLLDLLLVYRVASHSNICKTIIIILIYTIMKALKCKPSAQFAYNYSINVLSKYSSIISHRSSKVDTSTINLRRSTHRSSKVRTSIINLRRSTHRSSKVGTSIIDLRRSTHRSSKVNTLIFKGRHIDH